MTKIWILEKFVSQQETEKLYEELIKKREVAATDMQIEIINAAISDCEHRMKTDPNGYWCGFEGKQSYKQFCRCALDAIRRNSDKKFRVMEAEVEDDVAYWPGYKPVKVNESVLRYLYTMK